MKTLMGVVLASFLVCGSASAQSTEADISARLMGKPLQLRGFWMDDKLKFDATGSPAQPYRTGPFTTSAFSMRKVQVSGSHLKIEGMRMAITFARDGTMARVPMTKGAFGNATPEKVTIEVDGHGNPDFTKELDAIFAESLDALTPSLPEYWRAYALKHFGDPTVPVAPAATKPPTTMVKRAKIGGAVKPPRLLQSVDPDFTDMARRLKYSGNVLVNLDVDKDGMPSHISIARPAGMGLDEQAIAAVARYKFAPAMKDGEPVVVELSIDVNFQIF
jgi:TonB family protein